MKDKKKAIIFGITGQDGSYLCDLLLKKGYAVVGVVRRSSVSNTGRIKSHLDDSNLKLVEGDISDFVSVSSVVDSYQADEIYNLAAQSHVKTSFDQPIYTLEVNTQGPLNILEAIRKDSSHSKFYQASTSEMFGNSYTLGDRVRGVKYQDEKTPLVPQSPYAIAKLAAHHFVDNYRKSYGVFGCSGILFNHESERRGELFVTRKITQWIAKFSLWKKENSILPNDLIFDKEEIYVPGRTSTTQGFQFPKLRLGNLDAFRDWGHAEDYVRAMWLMLQQEVADDYVVATGEAHSVRDFLKEAFELINIKNYEAYVTIDPKFYRPTEVDYLCGRAHKSKAILGWKPEIDFKSLVGRMVNHDLGIEPDV
ncbi:GDP-mannose 4,6-dehydratase [bacterium]|nr:GDP-mannose 4,6-dehydratase [bacterium]|tara:strand:- start:345 stop:1439 length:1095 start_codon:yes stop_codon:yes gene_type:complete